MALSASTLINILKSASDNNGAIFDPSQTAGMFTDGAATSATGASPVFSSGSYNFVAGDVGAWVYIGVGINWITGWYQIVSVASNNATLNATAGQACLYPAIGPSTATGCATTASPTGATWSIDYSRQASAQFTASDITCAGAGATAMSTTISFGKQMVGNGLQLTGGTNITTGVYCLQSVAAGTATFDRNISTGASNNGAGNLGGGLLTAGKAGSVAVGGNVVFIKYNATPFDSTSTSSNASNGRVSLPAGSASAPTFLRGYDLVYGDYTGNRPTLRWNIANASSSSLVTLADFNIIENLICDGNRASVSNPRGLTSVSTTYCAINHVKIMGTAGGFNVSSGTAHLFDVEVTDSVTNWGISITTNLLYMQGCSIHDNATDGLQVSSGNLICWDSLFSTNKSGSTKSAIVASGAAKILLAGCDIYNSGTHGVDLQAAARCEVRNTHFESNGGYGINLGGVYPAVKLLNCSGYNNTSGNYDTAKIWAMNIENFVAITAGSGYVNAGVDFTKNNTANQGALIRANAAPSAFAGYASTLNYRDRGAVQHQDPAGGGLLLNSGMVGGLRG